MKIEGFTQGPWSARQPNGKYRSSDEWNTPDNDSSTSGSRIDIWSGDSVVAMALESNGDESIYGDSEHEANAELIADAPAMSLILSLLCAGKASIRAGWIMFDGTYYYSHESWTDLVNAIGWDRARAALNTENVNG
jgi:hypothetical protein